MTIRHLARSYCAWAWFHWSRLSALFMTTCVIAALTIALVRTTHEYHRLSSRFQALVRRQERTERLADSLPDPSPSPEVARLLGRILVLLSEEREGSIHDPGPLSSSH
jgi:hypothetical protein